MASIARKRLAHYDLVAEIGRGGMGVVWKAVDTRLEREVAIKLLGEAACRDVEHLTFFEREAKALAALDHPNIVTVYAVEESEGQRFIVMELVRGESLSTCIPDRGLPLERLLGLAIPLADALGAAHDKDVTHRDLKPANILVRNDGVVKIVDFGLAGYRESAPARETSQSPTRTSPSDLGHVFGTLPYMSPEQVQGKPLDYRTDIYSLSVVLFEMATGHRPFPGDNPAAMLAAVLRDTPPSLTELNPAMPRQLERIVARGMRREPALRFQAARDLRDELTALDASGGAPVGAGAVANSIAVLPLADLSGDPEQEFFADGMTDALITGLAKIGALKVISRTSVMRFRGTDRRLKTIAGELGVDALVEGSVLRVSDRVRISVQLILARTEELLWAESFDRHVGDVLTLQSEVAHAVARGVRVTLTPQERSRLERARRLDPRAHEACLRGRYFWYKRTPDGVRKGLEHFEQAVGIDSRCAEGYAGIADSYIVDGGRFLAVPPDLAYSRAREAALRALKLDDDLAEAHCSLAAVLTDYDWDWAGAEREYRRALELNPSYLTAHGWLAEHLSRMGRHDEAVREARYAQELDPLSLITDVIVAWILFFARRYEEAIVEARQVIELDPTFPTAHRILGWACEEKGRYDEAIAAHLTAAELSAGSPNFRGQLGRAYALARRRGEAEQVLDELTRLSRSEHVSPLDMALIHLALGDRERALDLLERACDEHCDHLPYLKVNPRLDALRDHPRFQTLAERMGL